MAKSAHSTQDCLHFWQQLQVTELLKLTLNLDNSLEWVTKLTENYYSLLQGKIWIRISQYA